MIGDSVTLEVDGQIAWTAVLEIDALHRRGGGD
jgi:hypothetical protein